MSSNSLRARQPLSALTKLTLVALLVNAVAYSSEFIWIGQLDREVGIAVGCLLVTSALVAMGWRWTPAPGALLAGFLIVGNPFLLYNLSHPGNIGFFAATVVEVVSGLIALVAGIGATAQNHT